MLDPAPNAFLNIAARAGALGFTRISIPYSRTDEARNRITETFYWLAKNDDDTLVMLDCDHAHPPDVIERLVKHQVGVVGALYFARGDNYRPIFYIRDSEGQLLTPAYIPKTGLLAVPAVGTGAMAIQRWVLDELESKGFYPPYFRYVYNYGPQHYPSEDMYFAEVCERAGISHHVDCSLESVHLGWKEITRADWEEYIRANPDMFEGYEFSLEVVNNGNEKGE
jgi:hypothetical protein